ncbi:MAG: shikimate dehydrogenase [Bryobacteraceae bacterium]
MPANFKAELVGCLGQPVAENPTGVMQEAGFRAAGLNWRYLTMEVGPAQLADAMRGVRALGMRGINLTIPHKVAVMEHLDAVASDAALIGAVNTVRREGDRLIGENTDGKGFLRGVREAGLDPRGKRVAVLGAGGAARAIVAELALAGAAHVRVLNRSRERGEKMVADLAAKTGAAIDFAPWASVWRVPENVDLLVNATSIALYPDVTAMPPVDLSAARVGMMVSDVVFNPPETPLLAAARARSLPVLDGLSMLVGQGVIGFELWTGVKAPEVEMKSALRAALGV